MLVSCSPVNNITKDENKTQTVASTETSLESNTEQKSVKLEEKKPPLIIPDESLQNNITIILSKKDRPEIVNQFINIIELAVYQKEIQNISFSIKLIWLLISSSFTNLFLFSIKASFLNFIILIIFS